MTDEARKDNNKTQMKILITVAVKTRKDDIKTSEIREQCGIEKSQIGS